MDPRYHANPHVRVNFESETRISVTEQQAKEWRQKIGEQQLAYRHVRMYVHGGTDYTKHYTVLQYVTQVLSRCEYLTLASQGQPLLSSCLYHNKPIENTAKRETSLPLWCSAYH